jgi:hypothetical protein
MPRDRHIHGNGRGGIAGLRQGQHLSG